jgi:regulator of sigma E protease
MSIINSLVSFLTYVMWFIVVMIPLVTIHEFGHFIFAKLFSVKVPEFGIGVPPKAVGKRWKGLTWSLNWIPLGAFVRITGDNDAAEKYYHLKNTNLEDKAGYIEERLSEVVGLGDIQDVLERYGVNYDSTWANFAKNANNKTFINTDEYTSKVSDLKKVIGLEYDAYFNNKNKKEFNSLFFTKNLIQKILILVGGVTFNMLGALLIIFIALNTTGLSARSTFESGTLDFAYLTQNKTLKNKDGSTFNPDARTLVIAESKDFTTAANKAGLKTNMELVSFDSIPAKELTNAKIMKLVKEAPTKDFLIEYNQDSIKKAVVLTPTVINDRNVLGLSVTNSAIYKSNSFINSFGDALDHTWYYTKLTVTSTFEFFNNLFSPRYQKAIDGTASPVMISYISNSIFNDFGFAGILWIMALISISLAVFNILPIPALDGGRIVLVILEKIFGSRVKKIEPYLVSSTYFVLLGFMLFIFGKDILTIVKK